MVDHELRADDIQKEERLDGWKQIAAYFARSVRTVRRWEKREGLPVHRHMHVRKGTPYAYANELNEWMECRHAAPIGSVGRLRQEAPAFRGTAEKIRSIIVLPFKNIYSEGCDKHFQETLTAEVISHIARLYPHKVRITRPSRQIHIKWKPQTRRVQEKLGVHYILEGSVWRATRRLRITARVLNAEDQSLVWSVAYELQCCDPPCLEEKLAELIARSFISFVH